MPVRLTIAPFSLAAAVSDAVGCGQPTETFDYLTFQPLPPAIAASAIALPHNCSTVCVVSVPTTSTAAWPLQPLGATAVVATALVVGVALGVAAVAAHRRWWRTGVRQPLYDVMQS